MPPDIPTELTRYPLPVLLAAGAAVLVLLAVLGFLWAWWRRRRQRDLDHQLRNACRALLANFVIPDGNGGEIEVPYALLTARGIVLAEIKDVEGHVFGSESMQDWTVIDRSRRFTFPNPQPGLWDRLAAVRRLLPDDVPVDGHIAFTHRARFTKGRPRGVISVEELLAELSRAGEEEGGADLAAAWDRLREAAVTARLDHLGR
jgi:hypothetical protein